MRPYTAETLILKSLRSAIVLIFIAGLFNAVAADGEVFVTIGNETVDPGTTGFTVDVIVTVQEVSIRGVEINIGYDDSILTFKDGSTIDGNWYVSKINTVPVDQTNSQLGQMKILLASTGVGIEANTTATLARLTFDIDSSAGQSFYPLTYLSSSPGLRSADNKVIPTTGVGGNVIVTGVTTKSTPASPDAGGGGGGGCFMDIATGI